MKTLTTSKSTRILDRLVAPLGNRLTIPAAKSLLALQFPEEDHERMETLVSKAKRSKLTARERDELNEYLQIGFLLDKLHLQARIALKQRAAS